MPDKKSHGKTVGRTMVDSSRRHEADEGGRNPLTGFPLVPVGVVVSIDLLEALKEKSEQFISPNTMKPYGVTALSRILLSCTIDSIEDLDTYDFLKYLEIRPVGTSGRAAVGDSRRLSLLIPKPIIDRINEKVVELDNPLIGTSSVVRVLLEKSVRRISIGRLYEYIPLKHQMLIIKRGLTVPGLQKAYRKSLKEQ